MIWEFTRAYFSVLILRLRLENYNFWYQYWDLKITIFLKFLFHRSMTFFSWYSNWDPDCQKSIAILRSSHRDEKFRYWYWDLVSRYRQDFESVVSVCLVHFDFSKWPTINAAFQTRTIRTIDFSISLSANGPNNPKNYKDVCSTFQIQSVLNPKVA